MKTALKIGLACLLINVYVCATAQSNYIIWYDKPAVAWEEALPIGNGRLGAMCFGRTYQEMLQLNDITIWSGGPEKDANISDAYQHLPEIRKALRNKDYRLAEQLTHQYMTTNNKSGEDIYNSIYSASYQTLGNLTIDMQLPVGEVCNYRRWLDISNAIAGVTYKIGDRLFERELFASASDSLIMLKIKSNQKGGISFTTTLQREHSAVVTSDSHGILLKGNTDYGGKKGNCEYEARVKVINYGGRYTHNNGSISIQHADSVYFLIGCRTSYVLDYAKNYKTTIDSKGLVRALNMAAKKTYEELKQNHITDYQRLFNRLDISFGKNKYANIPTDRRLEHFHEKSDDYALLDLFYQYGRYLMISSSRANNPLPSNSQGIWGDGYKLPWHADYKSNINYQMNYWMVEASNLSECHLPMLRLTASLVEPGKVTAQSYFNAPGWVYAMMTNTWGWTSPGQYTTWGSFFGGSGWACQHFWEHYAYTQDKEFLRNVFPILKEACEFYLSVLVETPEGYLATSPSTSPENRYVAPDGAKVAVTEGSTIELSIIHDLFSNTITAIDVLNENTTFKEQLQKAVSRLRPLQVGHAGQLMEWADDVDLQAIDIRHRHLSHLFALHPGKRILVHEHKDLAEAAKRSIQIRGDDGTGWSLAWKINFWARLLDGDSAYKLMCRQLQIVRTTDTKYDGGGGTYPNLFDAHPPFQIDGNFGFVSGVNELLLQSHQMYSDAAFPNEDLYVVRLLPALPQRLKEGHIRGIRARGGFEIDMQWKEGKLTGGNIRSLAGKPLKIVYNDKEVSIQLRLGEKMQLSDLFNL